MEYLIDMIVWLFAMLGASFLLAAIIAATVCLILKIKKWWPKRKKLKNYKAAIDEFINGIQFVKEWEQKNSYGPSSPRYKSYHKIREVLYTNHLTDEY